MDPTLKQVLKWWRVVAAILSSSLRADSLLGLVDLIRSGGVDGASLTLSADLVKQAELVAGLAYVVRAAAWLKEEDRQVAGLFLQKAAEALVSAGFRTALENEGLIQETGDWSVVLTPVYEEVRD